MSDAVSPFDWLAGGLVVSCQASAASPLRDSAVIGRLAKCAELGGAVGLRIDSPEDIRAVRALCALPIIGLSKLTGGRRPLITPTFERARSLAEAGANVIAIEVSSDVAQSANVVRRVRAELALPVLADVGTIQDAERAVAAGAALVASTLSGYLEGAQLEASAPPDIAFVSEIAQLGVPVIAEGRYRTRDHVAGAFAAGAFAVVIGGAITDPIESTRWFTQATPRTRDSSIERRAWSSP